MKTRYILLGLVALATTVFATFSGPTYDNSKAPPLSLPTAYQAAITALGPITNQFHCVGASITTDYGSPRWAFTFFDTNTPPKWKCITVDFDGKTGEESPLR